MRPEHWRFEIRATAFPEPNPKVIELKKDENVAHVRLPFNWNIRIMGKIILLGCLVRKPQRA